MIVNIKNPCLHICEGRDYLLQGKKVSQNDSPFLSTELFGFDCACRAVAYARTAVNAFSSFDYVYAAVFNDATCRAAACASATTDAFGTDFMSHWKTPPSSFYKPILYQNLLFCKVYFCFL